MAVSAQPKPRAPLHAPDAAALRCARVALAAWRRGVWGLETRAANDNGERDGR